MKTIRSILCILFLFATSMAWAAEKSGTIPLNTIHGTTGQKGIRKMTTAMDGNGQYVQPYGADLAQIYGEVKGQPAIALVAGKDLAAAVKAARGRLGRARPGDATLETPAKTPMWAVAYLGTNGSEPPAWQVQSVEVKDKTIRVAYKKGAALTDDIHHYLVWVPLGEASAGTYTLELYDSGKKEVTLTHKSKVSLK